MTGSPSPKIARRQQTREREVWIEQDRDHGPGPSAGLVPGLLTGVEIRRTPLAADPLGGTQAVPEVTSALDRLRGRGSALPGALAGPLGEVMGSDFGDVSIHADTRSAELTQRLQARAFTYGSDIYFSAGSYAPGTSAGRQLLSHELAHVAQHKSGRDAGPGTTVGRADDPQERWAEAVARRAMLATASGESIGIDRINPAAASGPDAPVARRMIRRAGDKIAFDAKAGATDEDTTLIADIRSVIDRHQRSKRGTKDRIEAKKDQTIEQINQRKLDKEETEEKRIQVLKEWHDDYRQTGWHLDELKQAILDETANGVAFEAPANDEIRILNAKTKTHLYSIVRKAKRFDAADQTATPDAKNPVFVKKGTEKEYLQDANGIFISRFVERGCDYAQMRQLFTRKTMLPRRQSNQIGADQLAMFKFGARKETDEVTPAERSFLQQRDGSGPNQRMLSVTHAKPTRKIHSNHGELFGSEAIIRIDLAKMERALVFNLHSAESHDTKAALGRLDRKKSKSKEMEAYIYSAEKNRETVLLQIPIAAVVQVRMPGGKVLTPDEAEEAYDADFAERQKQKRLQLREAELAEMAAQRKRQAEKQAADEKSHRRQQASAEKDMQQNAQERRSAILDRVEVIIKAKNKLKKWVKHFDAIYPLLDDDDSGWDTTIIGKTALADISDDQADKVCTRGKHLLDNQD